MSPYCSGFPKDSAPFYWAGHGDGYAGRSKRQCGTQGSSAESDYELGYSTGARLALVQRQEGSAA